MKTETPKEKETRETLKPMSELAGTAMKNYEQAIRTGLKFQEEAGRMWGSMFNQTGVAQDWHKRMAAVTGMASSLVPLAQRRMEDVMSLMEKNSRTSAELLKKAVEAAQTPAVAESQAKWLEFWTSSMGAARSTAEAFTQIGTKAIDAWIDFLRKNTESADLRAPKAA